MVRVFALIGFEFMAAGAWAGPFQDSVPQAGPAARGTPATLPAAELSPAEKWGREEDQRIYAMLDEIVPEVHFEQTPLRQVLESLGEGRKVNVHVEWQDLDNNAVDSVRPVTLTLRNLPRWRVLRAVLDFAGGETQLGYEVRDGVLLIATRDMLERNLVARVYPVRDLLSATIARWLRQQAAARPSLPAGISAGDLAKATDAGYREELAKRSVMATQPAVEAAGIDEALLADAEEELVDVLRQSVAPDAWRENGGPGSVRVYNGTLVVYQCRTVQREVERLLADLRAAGAAERGPGKPVTPK